MSPRRRQVLFDATRLLSRADRSAPTGIDRVCLAYAARLAGRDDIALTPVRTRRDQILAVEARWFADLLEELGERWAGRPSPDGVEARLTGALASDRRGRSIIGAAPDPDAPERGRRTRAMRQFLHTRPLGDPGAGSLYVNVGHTGLDRPPVLQGLGARGVERLVMIHDLIPVTHPEFCRPGEGARHRTRVRTTLRHASRIVVNSAYTADELTAFARREGLPRPPVEAIHLGVEPVFARRDAAPTARPYFVHVGTIEARKNLAFLLTLWRRIEERMGDDAPRLVLVGRYGWENEAVLDHLDRSPNLQGLVHQASELADAAMARLLCGARGLVAPSYVEGFDLPAVEAASLGVPILASDIPAHRELAPHARLIDPLDGPGWIAAVEAATRSVETAPAFTAPGWDDHFRRLDAFAGLAGPARLASPAKGL